MGNNEYNFTSSKSYRDLLLIFKRTFGRMKPSSKQSPYGLGEVSGYFHWSNHNLDVAFIGPDNGPVFIQAITSDKDTKRTLKAIDKYYGVKPAKIFRAALMRRVEQKYLTELDRRIDWISALLVSISAVMLVIGLPNDIRWELVFVIAIVGLVNMYGKKEDAVDIRLFLVCTFWFLLPGIPVGILYVFVILIAYFFPYSVPPSGSFDIIITFLVFVLLCVAIAIACGFGGVPRRKIKAKWKYLSSSRNPASLDIAVSQIYLESPSFLISLVMLVVYTYLIRNILLFGEIERISIIISLIVFLPFVIFFLRNAFKRIHGSVYRMELFSMARDLPDFQEIVCDIGAENERRKRHHEPIKFG